MICAFFLAGASLRGCVVHLAAMLSDRGMNLRNAAMGSALLGVAVMMNRFFVPRVASFVFGCAAAGIGVFLTGGTSPIVFLGTILVGLGLGAEIDIIPYVIGRYFGLHSFAQIYSFALGIFVSAGAAGGAVFGSQFEGGERHHDGKTTRARVFPTAMSQATWFHAKGRMQADYFSAVTSCF